MLKSVVSFVPSNYATPAVVNSVIPLDFTYKCPNTVILPNDKNLLFRPISCTISSLIPNVYSAPDGTFKNNVIYIKRNVIDAYTHLTIPTGRYTAEQLSNAINSAVSSWYSNVNTPALQLTTNTAINQISCNINSSYLGTGGTQFCIDFTAGGTSQIGTLLGFPNCIFTADGLYSSGNYAVPNFNPQGTICNIICDLAPYKYVNGMKRQILFSIPMELMQNNATNITFPNTDNRVIPVMDYDRQKTFTQFKIFVQNENGKQILFQEGLIQPEWDICIAIL